MTWLDVFGFLKPSVQTPSGQTSANKPATLAAELRNKELDRPIVFDPALQQFSALRAGEPRFTDRDDEKIWYSSRLHVMHHILTTIGRSQWSSNLLLRGSSLMTTWVGPQARRPGDLDWVVMPLHWKLESGEARELIRGVTQLLSAAIDDRDLVISGDQIVCEEIWLYDRAPGIRLIVPWVHRDSKHDGTVQLDLVFGEHVPSLPVQTAVMVGPEFPPIPIQTATPEQSLAWKLQWLVADCYPLGKDLYDAVLLAESYRISAELVRATFASGETSGQECADLFKPSSLMDLSIEWGEFLKEYPDVQGTDIDWKQRLVNALQPLIAELSNSSVSGK